MRNYLIKKIKTFCNYFTKTKVVIILSKKGYGNSYNHKDKHLFFEKNK